MLTVTFYVQYCYVDGGLIISDNDELLIARSYILI